MQKLAAAVCPIRTPTLICIITKFLTIKLMKRELIIETAVVEILALYQIVVKRNA